MNKTKIVDETVVEEKMNFKQTVLKNKMTRTKPNNKKIKNMQNCYWRTASDLKTAVWFALWLQETEESKQEILSND